MNTSISKQLRVLALITATGLLVACGSDSDNDSGSQPASKPDNNTETGPGENTAPSTPAPTQNSTQKGITGSIDGVEYNYSGDIRYIVTGDSRGIEAENINDGTENWSIASLIPEEGTYTCDPADPGSPSIQLTHSDAVLSTSKCSITVTETNSMQIEGYFTATLTDAEGITQHDVTDGAFHISFEDAILDLDEDGISDADDNCPFDANPDQLDDNLNRVGNVCEA